MKLSLPNENAPRENSDKNCANAQADRNRPWAHMSEGSFFDLAAQVLIPLPGNPPVGQVTIRQFVKNYYCIKSRVARY